ncbi:MAG TPA: glycosyltransferase family 1 protein [Candidatus Woesebacteria bacterium]|nr:glycosyltransferase family 1 protein [Candidatus Woesebacteria bacterium]
MRIGIDARLYGLEHAGLGRYVMKLVSGLLKHDKKNEYVLFLKSQHADEFRGKKRVKVVVTDIPIYSLSEQTLLPFVFSKEKLDLLHVPHFNAPLLYPGKLLLTIHDLIKHDSKGPSTTTRHQGLYLIKRSGYLTLMRLIVKKASHILVPSNFVKEDLAKRLQVPLEKITVTYEASSGTIKDVLLSPEEKLQVLQEYHLSQPFIVYTGSVYPHKNVDVLIQAIEKHNQYKEVDLQLALICSRSVFWERLNNKIIEKNLQSWIKLLGYVNDDDVSKIYSLALALVHPSKMEGFGLTGIEAMSVGLPVISSNASCLPEVYGDAALYFNPNEVDDLVSCLEALIKDQALRDDLSTKGYIQSRKYSWDRMAKETFLVYKTLFD